MIKNKNIIEPNKIKNKGMFEYSPEIRSSWRSDEGKEPDAAGVPLEPPTAWREDPLFDIVIKQVKARKLIKIEARILKNLKALKLKKGWKL